MYKINSRWFLKESAQISQRLYIQSGFLWEVFLSKNGNPVTKKIIDKHVW